jgi:hypothetical protein
MGIAACSCLDAFHARGSGLGSEASADAMGDAKGVAPSGAPALAGGTRLPCTDPTYRVDPVTLAPPTKVNQSR